MTMLQHGLVPSTGGYQIERSLRFNSADTAYLNRTPASAGSLRKWTWSGWVKRGSLGVLNPLFEGNASAAHPYNALMFTDADVLRIAQTDGAGQVVYDLSTSAVYRDPSAWYHVVLVYDSDNGTAGNRAIIYVNNVSQTLTGTQVPVNTNSLINGATLHNIGRLIITSNYFSGYLTEVNFIDGQALTPSSFGETDTDTGVWKPKAYSGSYGTNGFYLKFADNSGTTSTTLGKDSSGNGNNWTPNNFSVTAGAGNDSLVDTPTPYGTDTGAGGEVRGNYCTLNPLANTGAGVAFSNGNLDVATGTQYGGIKGTFGMSSGKWYWEVTFTSFSGNGVVGIYSTTSSTILYPGGDSVSYGYVYDGTKITNNGNTSYGASWTTNDVIGVALDLDAGTLTFYKNGSSQGTAFSSLSGTFVAGIGDWDPQSSSSNATANFGQRPFAYTAPSGFKALCTQNLPTPTIGATATTRADDYFNTVLWTGNGTSQSITGVGFQPDFVWGKGRSNVSTHALIDAVRGRSKVLYTYLTSAEATSSSIYDLTSFDSDGFSVGPVVNTDLNANNFTNVGWCWKANGAGSSNTQGTITSTVSANTTAGFSIVTWSGNSTSGATIGHGLGVAPSMFIVKVRNKDEGWVVGHTSIGWTNYLQISNSNASAASAFPWNNTAPTSSVITLGSGSGVNGSTYNYVGYAFAPVAGYSAFGSYTGNGSTDGPFVYTGFRPKYLMWKRTDTTGAWIILDAVRETYNPEGDYLLANAADAEVTADLIDFTSNGFKIRNSTAGINASSGTYVYAAFAEVPQKFSLAR